MFRAILIFVILNQLVGDFDLKSLTSDFTHHWLRVWLSAT